MTKQESLNLKSIIIKEVGTAKNLAARLDMTESQLSQKITGKRKLSQEEVSLLLSTLNCKYEDIFIVD